MNFTSLGTTLLLFAVTFAQAGERTNSLIIGASQEPPNLMDPWSTNNLAIAAEMNGFMMASLIYRDNEGKLHPEIAQRVPSLENGDYKLHKNAAGKVISNSVTYTIRSNAQWSDGQPITSQDFAFWLKVAQDKRVPVHTRSPWQNARIKQIGSKKFTIIYKPPYLFADTITPSLAPKHIFEEGYQRFDQVTTRMNIDKDALKIHDFWKKFIKKYTTSAGMPRVCSGAFKPSSWRPGNNFIMVRNNKYWRKPKGGVKKYIQSVQYVFIPDTNTLKINMLSGRVDALSYIGLTLDQALALEKARQSNFVVKYFPGTAWEQISIPYRGARAKALGLTDKRVRQALLYSIDRRQINEAIFSGKQLLSHSWVNFSSELLKTDAKKYRYNPEKAKALFAAAGWRPGPDGVLQKKGKRMILKMTTTAGNRVRERIEVILKDQWRKVGVQLKIQNYPASIVFRKDFVNYGDQGKWDLFMFALRVDPLIEDGSAWIIKEVPTKDNGFTGSNYIKYQSKAYDTLWRQVNGEFNARKRFNLFDKMQQIWIEDLPVLPLYYRMSNYARAIGLVNYDYTSKSSSNSWNAYKIGWKSKGAIADK